MQLPADVQFVTEFSATTPCLGQDFFHNLKYITRCIVGAIFYERTMRMSDRSLNRLKIVKAIRRFGPVARTDLPKLTGLSAGLITQETSELVRRCLVTERKDDRSRKGRPRTFLEINGNGSIVIGASIEGLGVLTVAFVTLAGDKQFSVEIPISSSKTLAEMSNAIASALREAIAKSPFKNADIARIGIGLPAILDSLRGEVHYTTTFPAEITPFSVPISKALDLPVTIENEMVSMARAEHWFGNASAHDDFTMIHVGFTIWSANYAFGLPHYGSNGLNSEIGHMKTGFGDFARPCLCGAAGCLTTYCSMYGILEAEGLLRDVPFPPVESLADKFDGFMDQAIAGAKSAVAAVQLAGTHLGVAMANHLNATDPGIVYIAVDNPKYLSLLKQPFHEALEANTLPGVLPATQIEFFQATNDWRWAGTAAMALEQAYLDEN